MVLTGLWEKEHTEVIPGMYAYVEDGEQEQYTDWQELDEDTRESLAECVAQAEAIQAKIVSLIAPQRSQSK